MKNRFSTNQNRQLSNKAIDSKLSLFDKNSRDLELFNLVDDELIRLSGSKIFYYKTYLDDSYDRVYLESRNRIVSKTPIALWASFDPSVIEEEMSEFGLELTNNQTFVFNKSYIEQNLGRPPIVGDIIKTTFQNIKYEIFEVQEDSFEGYGAYHYNCFAKVLRDSEEIVDEPNIERFDRVGRSVFHRVGDSLVQIPQVFSRLVSTQSGIKPEISPGAPEGGGSPEVDGLTNFSQSTTVKWDADGVVYVEALNDIDGYFALGYVHAREYGDALYGLLSTATGKCYQTFNSIGTLSNNQNFISFLEQHLAGGAHPWRIEDDGSFDPTFYSTQNIRLKDFDRYLHFFNVPAIVEELYNELDANTKQQVDSFANGVNAAIECLWNTDTFAISRSFFGSQPPITFRPQDIVARDYLRAFGVYTGVYASQLATSKVVYREVSLQQAQEFVGAGGDYPLAGSIPLDTKLFSETVSSVELPEIPLVTIDNTVIDKGSGGRFELSNEWAVHGSKTISGRPILQTDPHLYQKDSWTRFLEVSYASDTTKFAGGMLAGIPNVLLGYNENVSWGLTANNTVCLRPYLFLVVRDPEEPEIIQFFLAINDPEKTPLDLVKRIAETDLRSYASTEPPIPVSRCQRIDKNDIGLILDTWYTDAISTTNPLPPCARPLPGPNPIYEVGLAIKFGKDAKFNGIRLFSKLNRAANAAEVKSALAAIDTPFYNFVYATRQNVIGYYNLGTVPKYNNNPYYFNEWDPQNPTVGFNRILFSQPLFTHRNSLQFFDSVHSLEELPHVENPAAGWLVGNNASPNYVTNWTLPGGGRDPKEIKVFDFPTYMHQIDGTITNAGEAIFFPERGNDRQKQFFSTIGFVLANNQKASVDTMKNIIGAKGSLFQVSEHFTSVAINLFASWQARRSGIGATVRLPAFSDPAAGISRPSRPIDLDHAAINTELTLWDLAAKSTTIPIRAKSDDVIYPRIHYVLERLYAHYGSDLRSFSNNFESNLPYYSAPAGSSKHDTMTWNPQTDLLSTSDAGIMVAVLFEAITDWDNMFGGVANTPSFGQLFKANSSLVEFNTETGSLYPMAYGGKNLKTITYKPIYENGVLSRYEAFAGQVQALTIDFGPTTTQAHLAKPIHGTYDTTKPYFESLTQKWSNSEFATISTFGVLTTTPSDEVVINSATPCQGGGQQ